MAIEFVTAYKGEPHVTADDVGGFQQGICGMKDYVLSCGGDMAAELVTNNIIKIHDGEAVMQGRHWRIKPGTYETVNISNGSQGMHRRDMIIARYTKESEGVESIELDVLRGTPTTGNAVLPVPVSGIIRTGALKHEMPLYVVELNGLNVIHIMNAFPKLMNLSELKKEHDEFRKKGVLGQIGMYNAEWGLSTAYQNVSGTIIGEDNYYKSEARGITIKEKGLYLVNIEAYFKGGSEDAMTWLQLKVNGVERNTHILTTHKYASEKTTFTKIYELNAGDKLELFASASKADMVKSMGKELVQVVKLQ